MQVCIEWVPKHWEPVWVKIFNNWSHGNYIGYDLQKKKHIIREDIEGGGNLYASEEILPEWYKPNEKR